VLTLEEQPVAILEHFPASAVTAPRQAATDLPTASVIIVNMNGREDLERCLPAIMRQDYDNCEILLIDNASTDGSCEYVARAFPEVRIVRNDANLGYAGANNIGFQLARGEYLAVLNPDTEVRAGWLRELVLALDAHPEAGLATPKILMMDEPSLVNTCGNNITITGLTFCRGLDEPAESFERLEAVSAVSGAAFVIRRSVLEAIGGFDEDFFMYFEETDLSLRAALAGFACLYVPTSVILHKYDFRFSAQKCYYQERNRYFSLLKTLRWPTLLALLPALLIAEAIAWGYAGLQGRAHLRGKLRSHAWLFTNLRRILAKRAATQRLRRVSDRVLLRRFTHRLGFARTISRPAAVALGLTITPLLFVLRSVSRALVWW
jgi:GT2 family glycosyltransferase